MKVLIVPRCVMLFDDDDDDDVFDSTNDFVPQTFGESRDVKHSAR